VTTRYSAERAVSPSDGSIAFVVIDEDFNTHAESVAYLAWLRALDRSPHTERIYAGRIAVFLTYCEANRLDWRTVSVDDLSGFLRYLIREPIGGFDKAAGKLRFQLPGTANAVMTAVCEFLRFAAARKWVAMDIVDSLSHPKYLRHAPPGYDFGEDRQFRTVPGRAVRFRTVQSAPAALEPREVEIVLSRLSNIRDRLLVTLLAESGVRIGEALGLRRDDMHLLSSSKALGCKTQGPHLHVRRRLNANGALAKSRAPRSIPVTHDLAGLYADYQHARSLLDGADTDFVFVNMRHHPIGAPMRYQNAKKMFDRISDQVGFSVRPHMFRHSAATRWIEEGMPRDVVQALLGHASSASMEPYLHPTEAAKRQAVDRCAPK
jgi:integrase/recombinase XerD